MDFSSFSAHRQAWLATRDPAATLDAGETNLYRTLARANPEAFGPIAQDPDARAAHRCHVAEVFLDLLGLPHWPMVPRTLVSQGVRHSLALIFRHLAATRSHGLWLPSDVYPVYGALAQESGLTPATYTARTGLPWQAMESRERQCLLVCDPLKPWGGRLSAKDLHGLAKWARDTRSQVLVDAAYDLSLSPALRSLLADGAPIAFLGSLSKGFLAPLCAGVVVASIPQIRAWRPAFTQSQKNEPLLRQAHAALTAHQGRPKALDRHLTDVRRRLLEQVKAHALPVEDPGHGYFLTSAAPREAWLEKGVLGIPASAFGSTQPGTVLSALALA